MRAIVFGSTGFIGKAIYERLLQDGHTVLGVSRHGQDEQIDIVNDDINKIYSVVKNFNPDHIFHYAADPLVKNFGHEGSQSNIVGTHKLLDVTPFDCKFVFASSMTVYGANRNIHSGTKTKPKSIYALSKLFCEQLIEKYENPYKRIENYKIIRYCAHVGKESTHGLLHDIVEKLRGPNPVLELLGRSPGSLKPFIHIDDSVTETLLYVGGLYKGVYRVCSETSMTVAAVAELVMAELGIQKPIKFIGVIQLYQRYNYGNQSQPKKLTSEEAIKKYVRDIR
jgi:UDP-glucose 4-epimerase